MKKFTAYILSFVLAGAGPAIAGDHPVVVELFTSQGCSSCPPADKVLAELSQDDDIIALSWAVHYWDYLGWRDTLASPAHTLRQRAYNSSFGRREIYTPQMVVDGEKQLIGSRRHEAIKTVSSQKAKGKKQVNVDIMQMEDGNLQVRLDDSAIEKEAVVRLVWFDSTKDVNVKRGENGGRNLTYHNVVRGSQILGHFDGKATSYDMMLQDARAMGCDGVAVLVQSDPVGPIIGAAKFALN